MLWWLQRVKPAQTLVQRWHQKPHPKWPVLQALGGKWDPNMMQAETTFSFFLKMLISNYIQNILGSIWRFSRRYFLRALLYFQYLWLNLGDHIKILLMGSWMILCQVREMSDYCMKAFMRHLKLIWRPSFPQMAVQLESHYFLQLILHHRNVLHQASRHLLLTTQFILSKSSLLLQGSETNKVIDNLRLKQYYQAETRLQWIAALLSLLKQFWTCLGEKGWICRRSILTCHQVVSSEGVCWEHFPRKVGEWSITYGKVYIYWCG